MLARPAAAVCGQALRWVIATAPVSPRQWLADLEVVVPGVEEPLHGELETGGDSHLVAQLAAAAYVTA